LNAVPNPDPRLGVFETTLVVSGAAIELDAHVERMRRSCRALYDADLPRGLGLAAAEAARAFQGAGRMRLWARPEEGRLAHGMVIERAGSHLLDGLPPRAADLAAVSVGGGLGAHKWVDRRALDDLRRRRGIDASTELLLIGSRGDALESERGNLFALLDGVLTTPPDDGRILPGVTRARVLDLARARCTPTSASPLSLDALRAAEGIFLTSSVRGIQPVRACAGVGSWGAGYETSLLHGALVEAWSGARAEC
jgi:para-aminobenzoate synthetase/4-amino-4-deoxychorismate lyase